MKSQETIAKESVAVQRVQPHSMAPAVASSPQAQWMQHSPRLTQLHDYTAIANRQSVAQRQPAPEGGLPANLKAGVESLSGIAMDDVRVHYNSDKPAQLQAHAYAQGTEIHLAPGQERHLPHEAWHVVQQKQGRVKPTLQMKGVAINDDSVLEREADEMGGRTMGSGADIPRQMKLAPTIGPHPLHQARTQSPVQRRAIQNIEEMKNGIKEALDRGEQKAGSDAKLLSSNPKNLTKLSRVYLPEGGYDEKINAGLVGTFANDAWRKSWYDRVDARIENGAAATASDIIHWTSEVKAGFEALEATPTAAELLGDELHDRGLGPIKVDFTTVHCENPIVAFKRTFVLKPEDRSIEKAILGASNSVATKLNAHVAAGRKVQTLDIETDSKHGTMVEYVTTSLKSMVQATLRGLRVWDSSDAVTVETIGFAFLTGLYDLHNKNVMTRGGAPVLIDADVAARPIEMASGPSSQAGFGAAATAAVQAQIGGTGVGNSQILQYAIDHPDEVIAIIKAQIGAHRARIVPVHTEEFFKGLQSYLYYHDAKEEKGKEGENQQKIHQGLLALAKMVEKGKDPSPGLEKELGKSSIQFDEKRVVDCIATDFNMGVIPHFQYQPSTGEVFLHGYRIWKGKTLDDSLAVLKERLEKA